MSAFLIRSEQQTAARFAQKVRHSDHTPAHMHRTPVDAEARKRADARIAYEVAKCRCAVAGMWGNHEGVEI